ncbi:hypothetical protein BX666DRAFT_1959696 [Dichotomocladium elegans]|nr:hypothetical protein BX666DRAFT_1959696 [Dichotomocladium elegans]
MRFILVLATTAACIGVLTQASPIITERDDDKAAPPPPDANLGFQMDLLKQVGKFVSGFSVGGTPPSSGDD